jgi:hypothetical protein
MATKELFEAALGITSPWFVQGVDFEAEKHLLTIASTFQREAASRIQTFRVSIPCMIPERSGFVI